MNSLQGKDIVLKSDGNQVYSYCYVADACLAIFKIMLDGSEGEAYNVVSSESSRSLKEIASILSKIAETEVVFDIPSNIEKEGASKVTRAVLIDEKYRMIGGKSNYTLEEGLKTTIRMMKKG